MRAEDRKLLEFASSDLAAIRELWDGARAVIEPGRPGSSSGFTLTDEDRELADYHAFRDRAAAHSARLARIVPPGAHPSPGRESVIGQIAQAEWIMCQLVDRIRGHLGVGPLNPEKVLGRRVIYSRKLLTEHDRAAKAFVQARESYRADPTPASRRAAIGAKVVWSRRVTAMRQRREQLESDPTLLFELGRVWLQRTGLHTVHGDELHHAAGQIRKIFRALHAIGGGSSDSALFPAACPECSRYTLRAHLTAALPANWAVECTRAECAARWPWRKWDQLSERVGFTVDEVLRSAVDPTLSIEIFEDEDGLAVYAEGHLDPVEFLAAVDEYDRAAGVIETPADLITAVVKPVEVRHTWWRTVDPDGEQMERCEEDDVNAWPYTQIGRPQL